MYFKEGTTVEVFKDRDNSLSIGFGVVIDASREKEYIVEHENGHTMRCHGDLLKVAKGKIVPLLRGM